MSFAQECSLTRSASEFLFILFVTAVRFCKRTNLTLRVGDGRIAEHHHSSPLVFGGAESFNYIAADAAAAEATMASSSSSSSSSSFADEVYKR